MRIRKLPPPQAGIRGLGVRAGQVDKRLNGAILKSRVPGRGTDRRRRVVKTVLLIDGYNVIRRDPALRRLFEGSLESARTALIRYCAEWRSRRRDFDEMCIVFDGDSSVEGHGPSAVGGVHVLYTASRREADDDIRMLVAERSPDRRCTVVTDDGGLAGDARAHGAEILAVRDFLATLRPKDVASAGESRGKDGGKTGLSPDEVRRLNRDLAEEWGIGDRHS